MTDAEAVERDGTSSPVDKKEEVVVAEENNPTTPNASFWKTHIIGDYDYGRLCMPRFNPWKKDNQDPLPFYQKDDRLAWLLAACLGFQHSLAVVGGTIIPGILLGNQDPSGKAGPYLVSYALLTSGICTWIQILHTPIPRTKYFLGSGMLCVIATSFAFLPTTQRSIDVMMAEGKTFDEAYGSMLGTFMVGAIFQSLFSFIPGTTLRRIFPNWLAGLGVFLIGINLTGVGVNSWGGGGDCYANPDAACTQVGDSKLPYGSSEYIGLGFFVFTMIVVMELFGSHFLRSCGIAIALLLGFFVASLTTDRNGDSYVNLDAVEEAPSILFLWVKTFPIGFYGPAFLPILIAYVVSTIETYGDTTATAHASGVKKGSQMYDETIQGGLLGDSVNSFFSALSMVLPSTTLSQNIGIISLTKVASKDAGYACGIWMFIYGVFGKVGAFFTSVPQPVLGGMSTFLFANIAISGIKVMTSEEVNRRARFILAIASSLGVGTITRPLWFGSGNFLDCPSVESAGTRGLCEAAQLTLSTGYAVGCLAALLLNAILPAEEDNEVEEINQEDEGKKLIQDDSLEEIEAQTPSVKEDEEASVDEA